MAEEQDDSEKTEEPTQRRLEEARKQGNVAKSQEVPVFFSLFGAALLISTAFPFMLSSLTGKLTPFFSNAHAIPTDPQHLHKLFGDLMLGISGALALPLGALFLIGIGANLLQHPFVWSYEPLTPKFDKINPFEGAKRLFSTDSLVNFAKGFAKLIVVGAAISFAMWPKRDRLEALIGSNAIDFLTVSNELTISMLSGVLSILFIIAIGDYIYQYFKWRSRLRMSRKELKEEVKQQEGSPEYKQRVRQIGRQRAKRRMIAEVPKATVVITNPTHFAVALRYEKGMAAPVCIAKGVDSLALKIREVAKQAGVAVVENPPLARVLHASIDIDDEIPVEHYKAVAQVIGYVLSLKNGARRWKP